MDDSLANEGGMQSEAMNETGTTLTYGDLLTLADRGQRLRLWTIGYPCHEDGPGLRVLADTWKFLPVATLQASRALAPVIENLTRAREAEK
jgi:hypothetical protein